MHPNTRIKALTIIHRILILLFGYYFGYIQKAIDMRYGWDGIDYYAEVHMSMWNSYVHTVFMLCTMEGMFIWIPALFDLNDLQALFLRINVGIFYFGLYFSISPVIAILTAVYYYLPFYDSEIYYCLLKTRGERLRHGLLIATTSLIIQEVFGHYLFGDSPSRLEAIPNAILYAPFYSVSHMISHYIR